MRQITYEPSSATPRNFGKKRVGGPKQNWTNYSNKYIFENKLNKANYNNEQLQNKMIYEYAFTVCNRPVPTFNAYVSHES